MSNQEDRAPSGLSGSRSLPVILLAAVRGSMTVDGKIDTLNSSVEKMIGALAGQTSRRAEVYVAIATFGADSAQLHTPLTPAPMASGGHTPCGGTRGADGEFRIYRGFSDARG